jgi:hypothetical protein
VPSMTSASASCMRFTSSLLKKDYREALHLLLHLGAEQYRMIASLITKARFNVRAINCDSLDSPKIISAVLSTMRVVNEFQETVTCMWTLSKDDEGLDF